MLVISGGSGEGGWRLRGIYYPPPSNPIAPPPQMNDASYIKRLLIASYS